MTTLKPIARLLGLLMVAGAFFPQAADAKNIPMVVGVPMVDLRSEPHTTDQPGIHDPQQESQLLYGERVRVTDSRDGWAQIEALEQAEYSHKKRWQGYPGWLPLSSLMPATAVIEPTIVVTAKWAPLWKDAYRSAALDWQLPLGTTVTAVAMADKLWRIELVDGNFAWMRYEDAAPLQQLASLPSLEKRKFFIHIAEQFLGDGYAWGGRSPHTDDARISVSGVDCSGLVNLAYRAAGMTIPRDAHEQYLRAKQVKALQPGDLIFLSEKNNPKHVVHVMLYAGNGEVIEAPGTGKTVRRIAVHERLGQTLDWLTSGSVVDGQTVYFGSYLP